MSASGAYGGFALYRRLLAEARRFWPHIAGLAGLALLSTPLALLVPLPLMIVVDSVIGEKPLPSLLEALVPSALTGGGSNAGLLVAVALVLAVALATLLHGLAVWLLQAYTAERLVVHLRAKLFRHVQDLPFSYHSSKGSIDSLYRIQHDTQAIQTVATQGTISLLSSGVTLLAMIGVTAAIDWPLALVALSIVPVMFALTHFSSGALRWRWSALKTHESSAFSVVQETLSALHVVKAFGTEERERRRFVARAGEVVRGHVRIAATEGTFDLLVGLTVAAGTAAALFVGVRHVQTGAITLGELLVVMAYLAQLYAPLQTISKKLTQLQSALASAERVFRILDREPHVRERPAARGIERAQGAIRFENVTFGYAQEHPVLRDISFSVPAGRRVGIYGPTGAGKSTLISLLLRFYDPQHGCIRLDDVDLKDYRLADLRNQFAMVLQEPVLFSTSIAENIAYSRPGSSAAEIEAAARAADAHEFIRRLPEGYDTLVGERGASLSGGQRQRISLARAFLRDAPILILDEPTSAVDYASESAIMDALERLMAGRTTFMIAHRLSTLERCDLWLELASGQRIKTIESVPLHIAADGVGARQRATQS